MAAGSPAFLYRCGPPARLLNPLSRPDPLAEDRGRKSREALARAPWEDPRRLAVWRVLASLGGFPGPQYNTGSDQLLKLGLLGAPPRGQKSWCLLM